MTNNYLAAHILHNECNSNHPYLNKALLPSYRWYDEYKMVSPYSYMLIWS